jgi:hypothetical protein
MPQAMESSTAFMGDERVVDSASIFMTATIVAHTILLDLLRGGFDLVNPGRAY